MSASDAKVLLLHPGLRVLRGYKNQFSIFPDSEVTGMESKESPTSVFSTDGVVTGDRIMNAVPPMIGLSDSL